MNTPWWHLPAQSTAVCTFNTLSKLVTSLISASPVSSQPPSPSEVNHPSEKRKSEASSASSLLHHHQYSPWRKGSLDLSTALNSEGNQAWLLHNPRDALTDQSRTDRQTGVRPQKTHPFPPAHTRTAPGSVPHTMQMGSGPNPSGKAKEASSEISGVSKS